jgi:hypothetical protein
VPAEAPFIVINSSVVREPPGRAARSPGLDGPADFAGSALVIRYLDYRYRLTNHIICSSAGLLALARPTRRRPCRPEAADPRRLAEMARPRCSNRNVEGRLGISGRPSAIHVESRVLAGGTPDGTARIEPLIPVHRRGARAGTHQVRAWARLAFDAGVIWVVDEHGGRFVGGVARSPPMVDTNNSATSICQTDY